MNHILNYDGYRLFQASFDPDEKGTVLSVNHDWWGTWITYIGYGLLYIGLIWILFAKGSRFGELGVMLEKVKKKKAKLNAILVAFMLSLGGQAIAQEVQGDSIRTDQREVEAYSSATNTEEEYDGQHPEMDQEQMEAARDEAHGHEHESPGDVINEEIQD